MACSSHHGREIAEPSLDLHTADLLGFRTQRRGPCSSSRPFPQRISDPRKLCTHRWCLCRSYPEEKRPGLCPRLRKGPCRTAAQAGAPPLALGLVCRITPACARGHLPNSTGAFTCGRREASLRWVIGSSRAGLASTEPVFVRHRAHSPLPSALSLTSQEACQPALPCTSCPFSPSGRPPGTVPSSAGASARGVRCPPPPAFTRASERVFASTLGFLRGVQGLPARPRFPASFHVTQLSSWKTFPARQEATHFLV